VNFFDDVRQPWSTAFIQDVFSGPPPSVDNFYARSSGGQYSLHSDVFGWFTTSVAIGTCNIGVLADQADALATASGVDLTLYQHKVYIFPSNTACHFAGTANWPGQRSWQNLSPASCTTANRCNQDFHSLVHEIGHNLGLDHAASYICTNAGVHVVLSDTCTQNEYGDQFDIMGCCQPSLFSNVHRLQLGWIPASQLVTVTTTQTLTITPTLNADAMVYRIPDGTGQYLYLENRAFQTAYDPGAEGGIWPNGNLLIRRFGEITSGLPFVGFTQLLDGSPADNDAIPNAKGLPIGASFTLPDIAITITNAAWNGINNTVQVDWLQVN